MPTMMAEQFLFRCRACGRVARESEWTLIRNERATDFWNIRRYPTPVCPGCESRDIDLNYGVSVEIRDGLRLHAWKPQPETLRN